ncbi:MAG: zf-HC2 domain-containing protein [Aeromicrobium sp.]
MDRQLSPSSTRAAESHLENCEQCRQAVRQQRLLKSRMGGVGHPEPPPDLVASLSTLPGSTSAQSSSRQAWWPLFGMGVVLLGASMAVVAVAYLIGPARPAADEVEPPFDRFAAEFTGAGHRASSSMTVAAMAELDEYGWPCHARLGGNLERVAGTYRNGQETVALVYSDGVDTLNLYEQHGALDPVAVEEFDRRVLAERHVWVRDGRPRVVTWHADGVIYTVVTELGDDRLGLAIADLPRGSAQPDPVERIGDGLSRMTTWISPA